MTREIAITPMEAEQLAQIAALETSCFSDPWPESILAHELQNPLSLWLCAMDGDIVTGYIGSQTVLGESDMMNVAVHPDYRRHGIGRALVLALCEALKKQMLATSLTLEVRDSNYLQSHSMPRSALSRSDCGKTITNTPKRMRAFSERN